MKEKRLKGNTLQASVERQRRELYAILSEPMTEISQACVEVWPERIALDQVLGRFYKEIPYCKFLYALDATGRQISDNIGRQGLLTQDYGRDRSTRPYMVGVGPEADFVLSESYISLREHRPSLTAIKVVCDKEGSFIGYIGADFDLSDLPLTKELYEEPRQWRQIKGDPSIRGGVFFQSRVESLLDKDIGVVHGVLEELMLDHGVYHVMVHYSSSRSVIWQYDDPFRYRLLDIEALVDPDTCLAFPRHIYPPDAMVPSSVIPLILERFRQLRFMDETLYLRTGTLNIFNGIVGLTFSCDGSHYLSFEEFLDPKHTFWLNSVVPS